jgi:tight adherence protein C
MIDLAPILIPAFSFAAVAAVAIVAGNYLAMQARMRRRLPSTRASIGVSKESGFQTLHAFVARHFDAKRLGIDGAVRDKLRRDLIKAGYFRSYAVNYYVLARLGAVVVLPIFTYVSVELARPDAPAAQGRTVSVWR